MSMMELHQKGEARRAKLKEIWDKLVGAKVNKVLLNEDKTCLRLVTDRGEYSFYAVGDCCSNSWIEHLNGVSRVLGGTITELPKLRPEAHNEESKTGKYSYCEELVQDYITTFKTDKGNLEVEFRNESNGYYSGWLQFEGDQYGDPVEDLNDLKEVTEDF